jgi:hypothetical protein
VTWASTITDEAKRTENISTLLQEWIAMDGDSARKWVSGSKLSDDLKKKFGPQ